MSEVKILQHQKAVIEKLGEKDRQLVVLPSGAGKTHLIAFDVLEKKPKTFLYIVHRNEILFQTVKIFREICNLTNIDYGIINADYKNFAKPYLFGTIQTLSNPHNIEQMKERKFDYVVIDEFHHVAADVYKRLLEVLKPQYLVGLTATPYRLDDKNILNYVDNNIAVSIDLYEGIRKHILVPFHYIGLYDDIDYDNITYSGFTYNIADLDRKLIIHKRDEAVIREMKERMLPEKRLTIAFCNSVEHVHRIVEKCNKQGIKAVGLTYKEDAHRRQIILDGFKNREYDVLFTRDILNEGVDFPECSGIMFLRPTISRTIFYQQLGRGLRKAPGKEDVLVLDFIGNYVRAFEKRKWFAGVNFEELDIGNKPKKPIYEYNHPKPVVEFERQVIQIMDTQEHYFGAQVTKDMIKKDYLECCQKEARQQLTSKQYRKSRYRKVSYRSMLVIYGSFYDFIKQAKIPYVGGRKSPKGFMSVKDPEVLKQNYYDVKKKWLATGKRNRYANQEECPPSNVIDMPSVSKAHSICYRNVFGGYRKFLYEIGEVKETVAPLKYDPEEAAEIKIELLIKNLQKKLGRTYFTNSDWRKEYGGLLKDRILRVGGFAAFRKKYGVPAYNEGECIMCGKRFQTKYNSTKGLCCATCRYKHRYVEKELPKKQLKANAKMLEKTKCLNCGKEIAKYGMTKPNRERNYCSAICQRRKYWKDIQKPKRGKQLGRPIQTRGLTRSKTELEKVRDRQIPDLIASNPGIRHKEIRKIIGLDKATATKILRYLVDNKVIKFITKGSGKLYFVTTPP